MDPDWDEVNRLPPPPLPPPGAGPNHDVQRPPTAMAFDNAQELLWVGTGGGRVTSYIGRDLQRYTAFRVQPTLDGPIRQFLFTDKGVIVLGTRTMHMAMRRGPTLWSIRHDDFKDLKCMCFTSKGTNEILVAGWQDTMFVIDVNKGEIVKRVPSNPHCYMILKKSRFIVAASKNGYVNILDPTSFTLVKTWQAHAAYINDMDAQGEFIVTCGASLKQQVQQAAQTFMLDPYVNVFDLKNMTSMKPVPFPPLAAHVRMHPRMMTTCIVTSQHGQVHVVDLMNPNTTNLRYANITYVKMFEIAPSGEALVIADGESSIHLWGSPSKIHFTDLAMAVEMPDPETKAPDMDWSPDTPLSSIGMHYYRDALFSAWPADILSDVSSRPAQRDINISSLKQTEWGYYGAKPKGTRRNQVEEPRKDKASEFLHPPKFLSEKARESALTSGLSAAAEIRAESDVDVPSGGDIDSLKPDAPATYRNLEIKYSKFGVDDFDFGFYNKTNYAGLENHIANSYANSLLQLMHYTPLLRNMALQHAASACTTDPCLLCEMGYVFDMLQKAEGSGSTCHATNMFKSLSNVPQAGPLGLLEEEASGRPLAIMVQNLSRFLLDRIGLEYRSLPPASTTLEQSVFSLTQSPTPDELLSKLLATSATMTIKCVACKNEQQRPGTTFLHDLLYPAPKPTPRVTKTPRTTFSQLLRMGVERETSNKGWCSRCQRYQHLQMRKIIHSVPAVLAINTAISTAEHRKLWVTPGWLPEEIGVIVDQGQFFCFEGQDLKLHLQRGMHNITVYSLVGMVVNIDTSAPLKPHLVSIVNVAHSEPTAPPESRWHLFNDFAVRPISTAEAFTFNAAWKTPSVLLYQLKTANNKSTTDWKTNLDTSVLYQDLKSDLENRTCKVLEVDREMPNDQTIVALDTEFVALKQPEIQMNADGERETIRPVSHALARVSVVRGSGEDEGQAFIDDYVQIREPIVDYLTKFSGIEAPDLNPQLTKHNLVSLKTVYKKLWVLLNLGCKFLGHGLKQDFRVINMQVPRAQVIDTIELFYRKERFRKLSLAFLAWVLLKEEVQLRTHDSIEDARTALKLYRKFQEFQDAGILESMLEEVYKQGRATNFKRQQAQDEVALHRTDTPPVPAPQETAAAAGPTTPLRKTGAAGGMLGSASGGGGFGSVPGFTTTPGRGSPSQSR